MNKNGFQSDITSRVLLPDRSGAGVLCLAVAALTGNQIGGQWINLDPAKASEQAAFGGKSKNGTNQ